MAFDLEDRLTHTPKPAAFTPAAAPKGQPVMRELDASGDIRILILDDDPAPAAVIQAALSNRDFVIDVVSDPSLVESALARHEALPPDHPRLRPARARSRSRSSLGARPQPDASVIVVTGYPSIDSALNCLRARTYDYLTKPFQVEQLRQVVFRCLESKGLLRMSEEALRSRSGRRSASAARRLGLTLAKMATGPTCRSATCRRSNWARTRRRSRRCTASAWRWA